jgi:hypothetical protein
MVIASRAFGSNLPGNTLVPFADNINHANIPTYFSLFKQDQDQSKKAAEEKKSDAASEM